MKVKGVKPKLVSENVATFDDGHWEWFVRTTPPSYEITGKYLFFCAERGRLVEIAIEELENGGFHQAKTPMEGKQSSRDYVLCLYYENDSKKHELAKKYKDRAEIQYKYWKSDEATLRGEYSEEFLEQLSPEHRVLFTGKKSTGANRAKAKS